MPIRSALMTTMRAAAFAMLLAWFAVPAPVFAQQPAQVPGDPDAVVVSPLASLEPTRLALDQVEQSLRREGMTDDGLAQTRASLDPLRDDLRAALDNFERRFSDVATRLNQLGAAPAAGAPPEEASIAAERQRLNQRHGELDAAIKQTRLLLLRADDLAERITERRRSLFTRELFQRSSSALDPTFWMQAAAAVPEELRGLVLLAHSWWTYARDNGGYGSIVAALVTLAALATAAAMLANWLCSRVVLPEFTGTRFAHAFLALVVLLRAALVMPAIVVAVVLILDGFGLVPARIMEIGLGLIVAAAIASFGRGVALGLFAPDEPQRRLLAIGDAMAALITRHMIWAARVLAAVIFVNVVQRALIAPVPLTVATSVALAVLIGALLCHFLYRAGRDADAPDDVSHAAWLRAAGWLLAAGIAISLITGYIGLAAFLAGRFLVALGIIGALYICLVFTDALLTEMLTAQTPRGRAIAGFFGIKPRSIELFGTLLSALLRLLLVLVVLFPLLGPWGLFAADFLGVVRAAALGFRIGDVTISLAAILTAVGMLLLGILATRAAQRWLQIRFLPRTSLDPSLQHSVSTIFGYACTVALITLTMAAIGIDLQKITLVAGALSIGIGFGLQSVVSNFVSGLILLAERPIRVGDIINVKGEEGKVHRIHVRATEIETADRASVIIPNSELITGVVKNWTHADTQRRVVIKIAVGYDSNAEQARDLLLAILKDNPGIMPSPAPSVLITDFGESGINFELAGVVRNIADAAAVKSDLCFAILRGFKEARITIPYPQREVLMRSLPAESAGGAR
jgi:small-conductance mechanosensitive channel